MKTPTIKDKQIDIFRNVISRHYSKEAALDSIQNTITDLLSYCHLSFQGVEAEDIQILNNTLRSLFKIADARINLASDTPSGSSLIRKV